ncbi:bifunctional sugar phosphate isomerase/epimerase/4-hydroxyphenylpyruvate dioxygenase family protein [Croceicoccus sediminis]|uniref:bifunctional sugar phosphate isomerase/epimerase/4-hydroxyphenylpyruvate dioxygenase family protein n=1 Tax=Croceicoccus sediminis TaxID=2571150 RepID=UPI00118435CC|nr:sugar phosphate isomerase/epimerase and 4-hydroxyphenylpyruvate domain-containing protein [Croceicoccus sediminis]
MKTSIASVCLSGPLADKLQSAANAGFGGVEIFENDLIGAPQDARTIAQMMRDLGLACTMFQPFRDLEGMPEPQRTAAFARMERKFEIMDALGTDLVLLCSNCSPIALPERQRMLDDLHELGELAARHGKRIGYEALAWGRHVNDHRDAWSLVRDVDHPAIGLVLDSFHSLARDIPSSSIGDIRAEKLFFVQLADAPRLSMDPLSWSRHFRVLPGQGDWPVAEYVAAIQRTGYDGWFSLEIFNDQFRAGAASQLAVDGLRSLHFLEDEAARKLGRTPTLPDRVAVTSTEFIEFAASHDEAEEFARYFRALGFTPVARHRNKDVTRWKQGDINFVLNSEPDGYAHSHDMVHGGSVCAIGLGVTDQKAALDRAQALGIERFEQAAAPDEWDIPSLRGLGGSLLYLVDAAQSAAMWEQEFPDLKEPENASPLLTRIDHVAQTMQQGEFLSWLLFYVSLFDMDTTAQLEIADPMGLIYSQAVQNADRSVRFTLNGSLAHQSLTSRFIRNYFGAGVQHIALATDDIFRAAQAAADAGLPLLSIGPNYYDDIEARFGLEPDFLEQLRAANILYDRDEQGEYFQFYSRAVAKRVFFEVVQRRNYDAFGASNAATRLSAQANHRDPEWM